MNNYCHKHTIAYSYTNDSNFQELVNMPVIKGHTCIGIVSNVEVKCQIILIDTLIYMKYTNDFNLDNKQPIIEYKYVDGIYHPMSVIYQ